jgi:hypothetical protein
LRRYNEDKKGHSGGLSARGVVRFGGAVQIGKSRVEII